MASAPPVPHDAARTAEPAGQPRPPGRDPSATWLRCAAAGLGLLAASAAAVSFTAQYRMIYQVRQLAVVAALEACIPDAAALVFACLGIALALHGRRAIRARALNVAAVATSVFMNAIAAAPGWRDLAIWVMPPVAYALASDTLIGVIRARTVARRLADREQAGDEDTPLSAVGGLVLWLLRLALAPRSTLRGFRGWVITECPAAPAPKARRPALVPAPVPPPEESPQVEVVAGPARHRPGTKTAAFLALVIESHGPLACIPLDKVSKISGELAPEAGLHPGAARTALRQAVIAAANWRTR
jgi:hypothetical protein